MTTTTPALVEGQWVQDLRADDIRHGEITLSAPLSGFVLVEWPGTDGRPTTEEVNDLNLLRPVRGPVGHVETLVFTEPECPYDGATLSYDGGWRCETCGSSWDRDGERGERGCAECRNTATCIDVDGRPLCARCDDAKPATS